MPRSLRLILAPALLALVILTPGCPAYLPTFGVEVTTDVPYAVGNVADPDHAGLYIQRPLLLDVYQPRDGDAPPKPALLLVHGGYFTGGSKQMPELVDFANFFAQRGFVCFSIDYRLSQDKPPAPSDWFLYPFTGPTHAAIVDVKAAVRFVRANADRYGVDPNAIALLGESAGAIASVPVAVTASEDYATDGPNFPLPPPNNPGVSARVQALIDFWGNADLFLTQVDRGDPPVMIVHGTEDDTIGAAFAASERFDAVLNLVGVPHEFYKAKGKGHGAWDYWYKLKNLKQLTLDFLNKYMLGKKDLLAPLPDGVASNPQAPAG